MTKAKTRQRNKTGCIKDARGRVVPQFDPVRTILMNRKCLIPEDALNTIANEILPGLRRKKLIQIGSVAFGFLFVIGGNIVYFTKFSSWKGLDPVGTTIYCLQFIILLAGPVIAFRMVRREYADRIIQVMLKYKRCPHCTYDLRLLPIDSNDNTMRCPECGSVWKMNESNQNE